MTTLLDRERRMQIIDYSAGYPGAAAIKRAGYGGVIRYLRKEGTSRVRPITAAELADMRAHGLVVALVYQAVSTSRVTEGRSAGAHDARWALAQAAAVGATDPRCIYFAVDHDHPPTAVAEYFRGAGDVLGASRVGGYGGYFVLAHLLDHDLITRAWQTVGWSTRRNADGTRTFMREQRAHLFQLLGQPLVNGIAVDINDVLKPDFGQLDKEDDVSLDNRYPVPTGATNPDGSPVAYAAWDYIRWTNHYANRIPAIEAKLDAMAGALSDDEANIIAAIRAQGAGSGITPEQHADILRQQLPGAVLAALVELAKGAA